MAIRARGFQSMTNLPPDAFARLRAVSRAMVVAVTAGMVALVALMVVVFLIPAFTNATLVPKVMPFGLTDNPH
jgi:hypothetical protein